MFPSSRRTVCAALTTVHLPVVTLSLLSVVSIFFVRQTCRHAIQSPAVITLPGNNYMPWSPEMRVRWSAWIFIYGGLASVYVRFALTHAFQIPHHEQYESNDVACGGWVTHLLSFRNCFFSCTSRSTLLSMPQNNLVVFTVEKQPCLVLG